MYTNLGMHVNFVYMRINFKKMLLFFTFTTEVSFEESEACCVCCWLLN